MDFILKMFEEDLKELARMIVERQGRKNFTQPTETLEVSHEEVSETQEGKGDSPQDEKNKKDSNQREQASG